MGGRVARGGEEAHVDLGATALGELENGTRRAASEFGEFLEFFALALNYLSRPRALGAANTSKLSGGAAGFHGR